MSEVNNEKFKHELEIEGNSSIGGVGKTIYFDMKSDEFAPFRSMFQPHYAEYHDLKPGDTYWKKFNRVPKNIDLYTAHQVVRKNEDGTYEYIKNRQTGELRQLTEEETTWLILKVP